jgi:hypothetical protein
VAGQRQDVAEPLLGLATGPQPHDRPVDLVHRGGGGGAAGGADRLAGWVARCRLLVPPGRAGRQPFVWTSTFSAFSFAAFPKVS